MACKPFIQFAIWILIATTFPPTVHGLENPETLRSLEQVTGRMRDTSTPKYPVDFTATVNYWDPVRRKLFVQDGEFPIFVRLNPVYYQEPPDLTARSRIRVRGWMDTSLCFVEADSIEYLGADSPNKTLEMDLSKLTRGEQWSRRIKTEGTLRSVGQIENTTQLVIEDGGIQLNCFLPTHLPDDHPLAQPGTRLQVIGVLDWSTSDSRVPNRGICQVMDKSDIHIVDDTNRETLANDAPVVSIFDALSQAHGTTIHVNGTISHVVDGEAFLLEDSVSSILVTFPDAGLLKVGQYAETIGTLNSVSTRRPTLRASWASLRSGEAAIRPPAPTTAFEIAKHMLNHKRVAVSGIFKRSHSIANGYSLEINSGGLKFECLVPTNAEQFSDLQLRPGDTIRMQGLLLRGNDNSNGWFTIHVASIGDLWVDHDRIYVDRTNVAWWLGGFAVLLGLVTSWVATLRMQVRYKTNHLEGLTARLNASYEAIDDGIAVIDSKNLVACVNQNFINLANVTVSPGDSVEQLIDEIRQQFICSDELTDFSRRIRQGTRDLQSAVICGSRNAQMIASVAPIVDKNTNIIGRLVTLKDVTEQRELEAQLVHSQKMEAVGRLAGGVAHDFNNLLLGISANIELARSDIPPGREATICLEQAESATDKAAKLVKSLLGFSRQSALNLKVISLNVVVENVLSLLRHSISSKIVITKDCADDLWLTNADREQMELVLINVCLNACDAIEEEGVVSISTTNVSGSTGQFVRIRVEDNGVGMTPEIRDHIFEPFFTTKPTGKGTGLGLSMSYGLVEQHNGRIDCYSEPGSGTKIDIMLERCVQDLPYQPKPSSILPRRSEFSGRVLLVDDERLVRNATAKLLAKLGFDVIDAESGHQAIEFAELYQFEFVMLDLNMPEMSGREVFQILQKRKPDLPIVICTGYRCEEFSTEAEFQPTAFLQKPFDLKTLETLLQQKIIVPSGNER